MKPVSEISRHIYEYYEARILSGFYRNGEALPSIHKVSAAFHVSIATVRGALAALEEEEGSVTLDARRAARVAYRPPDADFRKLAAEYFAPRCEGIRDLAQSGALLLLPCWEASLRSWEERDWASFQERLRAAVPSDVIAPQVVLYLVGLGGLNNKLLINLYWEILHYLRFPFLLRGEEADLLLRGGPARTQQEAVVRLHEALVDVFRRHVEELSDFVADAQGRYGLEGTEPIPFRWRVYRQQPQLRYSLASRLIRAITYHKLPDGDRLPALSELAADCGVSMNTARRTVALLEKLGMVETHQGRRCTILPQVRPFDVDEPEVRKGLRLYLDALQILELTIRPVMGATLEAASPGEQAWLAETFTDMRRAEKSNACFEVLFAFIQRDCPSAFVRECYGVLLDLITWGFPLALYRLSGHSLHGTYLGFNRTAEASLRAGDWAGFAQDCAGLIARERATALDFIAEKSGLPPL